MKFGTILLATSGISIALAAPWVRSSPMEHGLLPSEVTPGQIQTTLATSTASAATSATATAIANIILHGMNDDDVAELHDKGITTLFHRRSVLSDFILKDAKIHVDTEMFTREHQADLMKALDKTTWPISKIRHYLVDNDWATAAVHVLPPHIHLEPETLKRWVENLAEARLNVTEVYDRIGGDDLSYKLVHGWKDNHTEGALQALEHWLEVDEEGTRNFHIDEDLPEKEKAVRKLVFYVRKWIWHKKRAGIAKFIDTAVNGGWSHLMNGGGAEELVKGADDKEQQHEEGKLGKRQYGWHGLDADPWHDDPVDKFFKGTYKAWNTLFGDGTYDGGSVYAVGDPPASLSSR